jgi:hypothetical protein
MCAIVWTVLPSALIKKKNLALHTSFIIIGFNIYKNLKPGHFSSQVGVAEISDF